MHVPFRMFAALICTVALLSGCTHSENRMSESQPTPQQADKNAPGSLIQADSIRVLDPVIRDTGAQAIRVLYRSTSGIDGRSTEVTGSVFIPPGKAPPFGWPVIAMAHPTSAIESKCAPSFSTDLFGMAGLVAANVDNGYAVAVTDYQGLGGPGFHPYLESKTAGLNVIDSVRALRAVSRDVSKTWAAYGGSQGGGSAAWSANEQSASYAPELDLRGSVSLAPLPDPSELAGAAARRELTPTQSAAYVGVLKSMERLALNFPIDDYRHGFAAEKWQDLSACTGPAAASRDGLAAKITSDDLVPSSPGAEARIATLLKAFAVPRHKASAPMLVTYGGAGELASPEWTQKAVAQACDMGSLVAYADTTAEEWAGAGRSDDLSGRWLSARFEGLPAPSTCPGALHGVIAGTEAGTGAADDGNR